MGCTRHRRTRAASPTQEGVSLSCRFNKPGNRPAFFRAPPTPKRVVQQSPGLAEALNEATLGVLRQTRPNPETDQLTNETASRRRRNGYPANA
jgi:hypothetical protein